MFVFALESYNDQEIAEAYAAGLYDVNRIRDRCDGNLSVQEIETKRKNIIVFDKSCGNPIMNMLECISENREEDGRTDIDKDGDEIVSSYRLLLVAHNSSGFKNWVVLTCFFKELTESKIIKTTKGLMSLSIRCGGKIVNTVNVPQYGKFTCTKSHIKGFLEEISTE